MQEEEIVELSVDDGIEIFDEPEYQGCLFLIEAYSAWTYATPIKPATIQLHELMGDLLHFEHLKRNKRMTPLNSSDDRFKEKVPAKMRKLKSSDLEVPKTNKMAWRTSFNEKSSKMQRK